MAVSAWLALPSAQKIRATVKVIGGPVYTAHQIDRLHYGPKTGVISSGLSTGWYQADVGAGPSRMMDGCGEQKRAAEAARAHPLASLSHHHAHCIKEIFHFWWAIMQLKYNSPGLTRIQKSHTYSILVFRVSGDLDSLLLQFGNR